MGDRKLSPLRKMETTANVGNRMTVNGLTGKSKTTVVDFDDAPLSRRSVGKLKPSLTIPTRGANDTI